MLHDLIGRVHSMVMYREKKCLMVVGAGFEGSFSCGAFVEYSPLPVVIDSTDEIQLALCLLI